MNETGTVRSQENNCFGNFVGCRRAARGSLGSKLLKTFSHRIRALRARGPGLTAFTRTPFGPYSAAQVFVSRLIAALLEP